MANASSSSLKIELARLRDAQRAALEDSTYISMNERERRNYDERAGRIKEIQQALGIVIEPPEAW